MDGLQTLASHATFELEKKISGTMDVDRALGAPAMLSRQESTASATADPTPPLASGGGKRKAISAVAVEASDSDNKKSKSKHGTDLLPNTSPANDRYGNPLVRQTSSTNLHDRGAFAVGASTANGDGRSEKATSEQSGGTVRSYGTGGGDRKERNRIAAQKSRQRRKEEEEELRDDLGRAHDRIRELQFGLVERDKTIEHMASQQKDLQTAVSHLREENTRFLNILENYIRGGGSAAATAATVTALAAPVTTGLSKDDGSKSKSNDSDSKV